VAATALAVFDRIDVLVNNASALGPPPLPYLITDVELCTQVCTRWVQSLGQMGAIGWSRWRCLCRLGLSLCPDCGICSAAGFLPTWEKTRRTPDMAADLRFHSEYH